MVNVDIEFYFDPKNPKPIHIPGQGIIGQEEGGGVGPVQ